jgi:uncharacterized protein YjbI with pentapeptide repeats
MQEVNLTGAILTNANFENADLKNAIFQGIDVKTKQIEHNQLKSEEIKTITIHERKSNLGNKAPIHTKEKIREWNFK